MVFFLSMALSYGVDTFAYTYKITNKTGEPVKVKLYSKVGKLNNKFRLIGAYVVRKFKFGGVKAGLCLSKIMVSTKDSTGKWRKKKKAEIRVLVGQEAIVPWVSALKVSMCRNRSFILDVDPKSGKIRAITE